MELGLKRGTVRIDKYNPEWKNEYLKEEKILKEVLKDYDVNIEHIGSTAIVGCSAKPIIDIAIGVPSLEYGKQLIPLLEELGWTYDGKADFGVRWFLKKCNGDVRTHFIHIENRNDRIWQNHIVFRDYLNANPDKVKEYSNIKETIEKEYADNRQGYAAIKDPFIENTIQQALKEWNIKRVGEDYEL
jgi:GrpB-like predicted nucleotidyltransferase (UPF0157 family)